MYEIVEIKALKRQKDHANAQNLLEKIAEYVYPIMCKRKYQVNQLVEFFPKNRGLLGMNVNQGWKICLRCRYIYIIFFNDN